MAAKATHRFIVKPQLTGAHQDWSKSNNTYVNNNPYKYTDPTGMIAEETAPPSTGGDMSGNRTWQKTVGRDEQDEQDDGDSQTDVSDGRVSGSIQIGNSGSFDFDRLRERERELQRLARTPGPVGQIARAE